jgi:hypothetical protein
MLILLDTPTTSSISSGMFVGAIVGRSSMTSSRRRRLYLQ